MTSCEEIKKKKKIIGNWEAPVQIGLFRHGYLLTNLTFLAAEIFYIYIYETV